MRNCLTTAAYTDTVPNGTNYYYKVCAVNSAGSSTVTSPLYYFQTQGRRHTGSTEDAT